MHTTDSTLLADGSVGKAHLHRPALGMKRERYENIDIDRGTEKKRGGDRQREGRYKDAPSLHPAGARLSVTSRQRPPAPRSFATLLRSRSHIGTTPHLGIPAS